MKGIGFCCGRDVVVGVVMEAERAEFGGWSVDESIHLPWRIPGKFGFRRGERGERN